MTEEQKKPYVETYLKEKEIYQIEIKEFEEAHPSEIKSKSKSTKKREEKSPAKKVNFLILAIKIKCENISQCKERIK